MNSMIPASQAPTINMMLQGMASHQGMGPHGHTLPSPSNSGAGFLLLQQPGIPGHHQGGRDISPGSTPGLHQPPPAATPPNLVDERNWMQQQQQNLLFGGPRQMMNMDKSLEEQIKTHDMFTMQQDNGYRQPQDVLNQLQMNEMAMARSLNQYPYAPAQSPPTMFQQQPMPHPMPPRPRPEGGQDPSPNFLHEDVQDNAFKNNKKEDLVVIDSWTGGPTTPSTLDDNNEKNQFYGRVASVSEDKEPTGWGAPPPTNPNGWGQPPPKIGNWQQPPPNVSAPPPPNNIFGGPPPHFERGGSRGGGGGFERRGGYRGRGGMPQGDRGGREFSRGGGPRGGSGMTRGGRGGRGGPRANPLDREQEKQDGKKNAIAETIAMMNKMKMEDKERKDAHQRYEEERRERNRELGIPEPLEPPPSIVPEIEHFEDHHVGRGGRRGRGEGRGQRPPRGGRGMGRGGRGGGNPNMGLIPSMFGGQANPAMHSAPGMFFPPPGMPGFPGMEQLLLSGVPGFPPGNYPGAGQPFFPHLAGGPPPQFGNQFTRFPGQGMGRGLGRGFMAGGRGAPGAMGRGGRGRGGRGGGHGQRSHEHQKPVVVEDHHEPDKSTNVTEVENPDLVEGKGDEKSSPTTAEAAIEDNLASSESSIPHNGENDGSTSNEDQSKNVISGQVCT